MSVHVHFFYIYILIYSLIQKSRHLLNVKLVEQFGQWSYGAGGYPGNRMPYIGSSETGANRTLLTAAQFSHDRQWAAIVVGSDVSRKQINWLPALRTSGSVWYWLNENDCDPDYRKSKLQYHFINFSVKIYVYDI